MGETYDRLDDKHVDFIRAQKMFFVATAPRAVDGHVNLSPKGYDSLKVIDAHTIAWLDLGGSGIETLAHLKENGRITLMWCAFEGRANILRVYGRGEAVSFDEPGFDELKRHFPDFERARSIIHVDVHRVSDSCGWGVPFFDFKGEREQLRRYLDHPSLEDMKDGFYKGNAESIDGLPGLKRPESDGIEGE